MSDSSHDTRTAGASGPARVGTWEDAAAPDLATQLEDILHCVWTAESNWRLDDRIDLAVRRFRAG